MKIKKFEMRKNKKLNKKGTSLMYQVIIHLILIALIFAMFFLASVSKINSNAVRQQVLEKQTALLVDSALPGTTIFVNKINKNGIITGLEIKGGRIFVSVNDFGSSQGYPYFSGYKVNLEEDDAQYRIKITK